MALTVLLAGCVSPQGQPDNTATGALVGGATGAIIGSVVARNPGAGAAVGAAAGVIAGGMLGHGVDQAEQTRMQAMEPPPFVQPGPPLGIEDVKALAKAGLSDDLIVSQIRNSGTVYRLGAADIIALKTAGVSEKVIDCMINTPNTARPPAPAAGTVVVEPAVYPVYPYPYYPYPYWGWYGGYWGHGHYRR